MNVLQICMLGVVGVAAAVILRQWRAEFAPLIRLSLALLLGGAALSMLSPLVTYLTDLMGTGGLSDYAELLLKALGIALLTECCANICRECGEGSAASGVELVGKVEILLLALPLIDELLSAAKHLLEFGS